MIERGKLDFRRGKSSSALVFFDKAIEVNPTEPEVHYQRSLVLARLGRTPRPRPSRKRASAYARIRTSSISFSKTFIAPPMTSYCNSMPHAGCSTTATRKKAFAGLRKSSANAPSTRRPIGYSPTTTKSKGIAAWPIFTVSRQVRKETVDQGYWQTKPPTDAVGMTAQAYDLSPPCEGGVGGVDGVNQLALRRRK